MSKFLSKAYSSQSGFRSLLPFEPEIVDASTQERLTKKFLLPELMELEAFFLAARALVDPDLESRRPTKLGKRYPLGQCLEITLAVKKLLQTKATAAQLKLDAACGYDVFFAFLAAGGIFRHVWGDLRGQYFQNAYQLGTLYVDVSNDTVTITKPKVEILPFARSMLTAVTDFQHFQRLAERYWQDSIFPNHVLPGLAPYCPLVHVNREGRVTVRENSLYMAALAQAGQFRPSEEVLRAGLMPREIFAYVANVLAGTQLELASSPAEGRMLALRRCQDYRARRWHASPIQAKKWLALIAKANRHLMAAPRARHLYTGTHTLDLAVQTSINMGHTPRYVAISRKVHAGKYWRRRADDPMQYEAAIPVTAQEMFAAMMTTPIGFVEKDGAFIPVAMQALAAGNHLFALESDGWPGARVPEAYRNYPFGLVMSNTGECLLAIDENGGLLEPGEEGEPLLNPDGTFTAEVLDMVTALRHAETRREATARSCAALQKHHLIQPWPFRLQVGTITKQIRGLFRVDEAALNQVAGEVLEELQASGSLAVAYCQLFSMQCLTSQQYHELPPTRARR